MLSRRAAIALGLLSGCAPAMRAVLPPNPRRPQLSPAQALDYQRDRVLAAAGRAGALVHDGWNPLADRIITGAEEPVLQYRVDAQAANGRTIFSSVQAAVNRAHHDISSGLQTAPRVTIGIAPGRYVETVYVPPARTPITLWGMGASASDVVIEHRIDAAMPRAQYRDLLGAVYEAVDMHPDIRAIYQQCAKETTTPTSCTAVVWVASDGFQARRLTVANAYGAGRSGPVHQAVALKSEGADRMHLEQVHLLGHQDTLYLRTPAADATVRSILRHCVVAGDVDFVFGPATAFFEHCEIRWIGARRGLAGGWIGAPSTHLRIPYGLVFDRCNFTSDTDTAAGSVFLARQWFTGARCSPYGEAGARCNIVANDSPDDANSVRRITLEQIGKMAVLNSSLGAHLAVDDPWAPWQNDRAHRAHRPAQRDSEEAWQHLLQVGRDPAALAWPRPMPPLPYLAEYNNQRLTSQ